VRGEIVDEPADLSALANNVTVAFILDAARESALSGRTVRLSAYRGQSQPNAPAVRRP
jgi:hypothetical protein